MSEQDSTIKINKINVGERIIQRIRKSIIEELARERTPARATSVNVHITEGSGAFTLGEVTFQYFRDGIALNKGSEVRYTKDELEERFGQNLYE